MAIAMHYSPLIEHTVLYGQKMDRVGSKKRIFKLSIIASVENRMFLSK